MGGSGSGNRWRYGKKGTVDASKRLDIRYLKQHDMLRSGTYNMSWNRGGEPSGSCAIRIVAGESMTVICRWRNGSNDEWQPMEKTISLAHTACALGGSRPWFVCPHCSRRVAVLILDAGYVACRHCLKLTYGSCNEDLIDRSWRRRDKYKARMGGDDINIYVKPKGMHQRTWERLRWQYQNAELQGWEWMESRLEALGGRL